MKRYHFILIVLFIFGICIPMILAQNAKIIHDAEYYILESQNGERLTA